MPDKYVAIPKEKTYALILEAQKGNETARTLLVEQNAGLVKKAASKFNGLYDNEDLIQIGYMGLIKAIDKFDTSFDVMFSTYAVPMIIGEIKRFLRDDGRIKASRAIKSQVYLLRKLRADLTASKGSPPRLSELAKGLGVSPEEALEIIQAENTLGSITSLDNLLIEEESKGYLDENSPESGIESIMLKEEVEKLPVKQRQIILLRYYKDMTQCEIASLLGISQVQVSRLEKRAIECIKAKIV